MSTRNFKRGSQWRRWDLHVHPPGTKLNNGYGASPDVWDQFIDRLESSSVRVFGITDYFCAQGYFDLLERYRDRIPNTEKVFFLNIEFRLAENISRKNGNPNYHVIFDNNEDACPKALIDRFLGELKTTVPLGSGASKSCADLETEKDFESASITLENLEQALAATFGSKKPFLKVFPANNDGVRSTDPGSPRKTLLSDNIDKASNLFFGGSKNTQYFLGDARYNNGASDPKPVVSCSDAHSFADLERLEGNMAGFEPTWIKADPTFQGLQQICFEPKSRVYIGAEPEVITRKTLQPARFLSNLEIDHGIGYDGKNGRWFKGVKIPINPELVTIIGNKGSGKSAVADIIGLLGHSRQEDRFSFLVNTEGNKKFRQRGYAENFEAKLTWESGDVVRKNLNEKSDLNSQETVRYLPQNVFEGLTNEIEINDFRKEIEEVVFSHVAEVDRLETTSFKELRELKTDQSKRRTSTLKADLRRLNIEIVELERQSTPEFLKTLQKELESNRNEIEAHIRRKPPKMEKPDADSESQKKLTEEISEVEKIREQLNAKGERLSRALRNEKQRQQELSTLRSGVKSIESLVVKEKKELGRIIADLDLDIDTIIEFKLHTFAIDELDEKVSANIETLEKDNEVGALDTIEPLSLESLPDLRVAYKHLTEKITAIKQQLGARQHKYQEYLEKVARWESRLLELKGDKDDPAPGSKEFIEGRIEYVKSGLLEKLNESRKKRMAIAQDIFDSKRLVLDFYKDLKTSMGDRLGELKTSEFDFDLSASFLLDNTFVGDFLKHINRNRSGPFRRVDQSAKPLQDRLADLKLGDFSSISRFLDELLQEMNSVNTVEQQVFKPKEFYDFLFSLEYISAQYELRLGGKPLNELSPGEKGLMLLVFYLQLDKDNIPLIIDQPEDNLDNESIFLVLAKCIREAKKQRQVILVTHNPNLAIGADAEQVIYVQLEKSKGYKFSYESGAIEDPGINKRIVDVLEGSRPAFIKRRLKYQIEVP